MGSWSTSPGGAGALLGAALLALVTAVLVERRHTDALVPPRIVRTRITTLSVLGSLAVGVAQFGASVFLAQYFQIARDRTRPRPDC